MSFDYSLDRSPFVNSDFYENLKKKYGINNFTKYSDQLSADGYCIIDLDVDSDLIDRANIDIDKAIKKNIFKKNSNAYHYNESPRIVEGWKFSKAIKELAVNSKLISLLDYCYQSKPIPFSTINFVKGTEQPLHSDEFHFGSLPHGYLTGVWIALENIHKDSGPLSIVKKSHKLPLFSFEKIGLSIPKSEKEFKQSYTIYENWVREMIKTHNLEVVTPPLKKGQCLVWSSNLLHGAFEIKNKNLSRKSLVVHYHYEKCEKIFFPSHSNIEKGKLIERSLKNLDFRNL